MSDAPFTLFIPFGSGYGNPGLTVRADSAKELDSILKGLSEGNDSDPDSLSILDDVLSGVATIKAAVLLKFPQEEKPAKPVVTHPQAQTNPSDAPVCNHGPMKYKEGVAKSSGKPYKAYFCPAPQGQQQCQAKFL